MPRSNPDTMKRHGTARSWQKAPDRAVWAVDEALLESFLHPMADADPWSRPYDVRIVSTAAFKRNNTMTTLDGKARILAVEDDPHIRILLSYLLQPRFDLVLVGSADEALRAASDQRFDLFLLDINLRERATGVDVLNALRRMPRYRATPAIACTAYAMHGDHDHFIKQGFIGYVGKPFSREGLVRAVEQALGAPPERHRLPALSASAEPLHSVAA